jgi:trimeric autotransporter adhesin
MERLVRILKIAILMASVSMLVAKPLRSTAQTNTGTIRGNVTDAQGAKISGASLLLINSATSVARTTATNSSGDYLFVALDPSTYSLRIEAPGFASVDRRNITVAIGLTLTVDQQLKTSSTSETIDVSAESPLIDTATAANGQTFTAQQLQDLPNMGRNPFILEKLDNNVVSQGDRGLFVRRI